VVRGEFQNSPKNFLVFRLFQAERIDALAKHYSSHPDPLPKGAREISTRGQTQTFTTPSQGEEDFRFASRLQMKPVCRTSTADFRDALLRVKHSITADSRNAIDPVHQL
jgi:hypothetical protein